MPGKTTNYQAELKIPAAPGAPFFTPLKVGDYELKHRIVLAPLTRCRAPNNIPQPITGEYYAQRATKGGLLITEATAICEQGRMSGNIPGIYNQEQIEAWKPIVKKVHDKGGVIFCQLWHVGRVAPPALCPGGQAVAPSDIPCTNYSKPRALSTSETANLVTQYTQAARNAIAAGFDGVEVHGANGYILQQYIADNINNRTDEYGGSIPKRAKLVVDVLRSVVDAIGAGRTGVRFSPYTDFQDVAESDPVGQYTYIMEQINPLNLAYVHFVESRVGGNEDRIDTNIDEKSVLPFRKVYKGLIILAGGYTPEPAKKELEAGRGDMVAFGRWFISNPDLVERIEKGWPLTKYHRETFYTQDAVGYTDYPRWEEMEEARVKGSPEEEVKKSGSDGCNEADMKN